MIRGRLLCAFGVSLWSAGIAGSQAARPAALSGELRTHVQDERFGIVTSIRGLPVKEVVGNSKLPTRRLVAAGCSYERCLVYYERGGGAHTWRVALFHWTPDATRFEWGGTAPGGLVTIDDVRSAILSGVIKGPVGSW
jgi:hypothetical protein